MGDTYSQLYIHIVFTVRHRRVMIPREYKEELHRYITGIITRQRHKLLEINCMPDHVHILIGYNPENSLSALVRDIKSNSSRFISKRFPELSEFSWQSGYGAFSYSRREISNIIRYIENQEEHHKKKNFREEYIGYLKEYQIEYNPKYLFDWIDN